jgi:glycosyltransferase involved in cell wall biosynthesis
MLDPWFKRTYPLKHLKKWMYWPWGGYRPLRDAGAVVFTCEEERALARQSFWLYRAREAVVGYGTAGPTGDPAVQKAAFLERFPELHGKRLCTYLGRLHPRKGCDLAIQAFGKVLAGNPEWQFVVVGPDTVGWKAVLIKMAEDLGIAHRVTWADTLSGNDKWGSLRSSELLLLPSRGENFGIVVAEALACGTPVLISDKVNIWREVLQDGSGLVDTDDVPGACRMLAKWAGMTAGEHAAVAANARPCFLQRFEIHAAAKRFINLLTAVVEGRALPCCQEECSTTNR